ncbi:PDZ domain-containing protein [Polaribacter vadi]|uniref:S41 family peptidase n=1 Tax=Polaribacter TaxID=52959 RepID=UPI001C094B09|nr:MULTISPECIES: S41 family peptidase [Polaribacter]MBU3009816.1 PDZ domain-containing protein [Polaribacter vadi]MDO6739621.1 S41 family peptidase [Polaribacter sp. 1_MG-2023]
MTKKTILFIAVICNLTFLNAQNSLVRTPTISPDASKMAFGYHGDIWVLDLKTNQTNRLTIHQAYESNPIWNTKSNEIIFMSNRKGSRNIFKTDLNGGVPNQITFYPTTDTPSQWNANGDIIFSSNRIFKGTERESSIYKINEKGETPTRFMEALGSQASVSPNGKFVAFVKGTCRISREDYNGPAQRDIWIYNIKSKQYHQITTSKKNDHTPLWDADNNLYYIGSESGRYNIYKTSLNANGSKSGSETQLTDLKVDGVLSFSVSNTGTIVYNSGIEVFKIQNGKSNKVNLNLATDNRFELEERKTVSDGIRDLSVSPNGKLIALSINGEIFVKENNKDQTKANNVSNHPFRDDNPFWIDDNTLGFLSDRSGQNELYKVVSTDENVSLNRSLKIKVTQLTKSKIDVFEPILSPNRKKLAYRIGRGQLVIADVNDGKLDKPKSYSDTWAAANSVAWSPDSKYIAYSQSDLDFDSEIYIQSIEKPSKKMNISMHPRSDSRPVWSPDGKKLSFVSNRAGDRGGINYDTWMVWLQKSDWEKTRSDYKEGDYYQQKEDKKKDKKEVVVKIDEDKIYDRLVQLTSWAGNEYGAMFSADSKSIYISATNPATRSNGYYKVDLLGGTPKEVKGVTFVGGNSLNKGTLYYSSRGKLKSLSLKSDKVASFSHSATYTVYNDKLNEQVFYEGVRAITAGFYDPQYHGYEWDKIVKRYTPWVLSAATKQDYTFMYNNMLGQLNASHMGYRGSSPEEVSSDKVGLLGLAVSNVNNGVKIDYILPNSAATKTNVSLSTGNVITAVNGKKIGKNTNFYSVLRNTSGDEILLTLADKKEVVVRTESTRTISSLRYEEWINSRKKLVDEYSNGQLGYIHIQGMNLPSFERFERELKASGYGKKGIVIDVRNNGGGWTTDRLLAVLTYQQHAYTVPRDATDNLQKNNLKYKENYPYNERAVLSVNTKPLVALSNQSSYSNAEIFAHAFKSLKLGKLVGQPTFGAVISTGSHRLQDGSIRMPYRAWYVKESGLNMEHGPAVPDVLVENKPGWKARNEDDQLKKAVEVLLQDIK